MTFKEMLRFTYGLVMGTSTPYLKPSKRFLFPTLKVDLDPETALFMGGSGICAVLGRGDDAVVINLNQGEATKAWRDELRARGVSDHAPVILNSLSPEFSGGISQFREASRVYTGRASSSAINGRLGALAEKVEVLPGESVLSVAGERVILIPVGPAATESDLVVFFENKSILFLGALFYNRIHPILRPGSGLDLSLWIKTLEELLTRFQPKIVIPGEGDTAGIEDVRTFIAYLRALANPKVEFADCRRDYDWAEIPSYTSLEENFDLLRGKVKNHTTLTS